MAAFRLTEGQSLKPDKVVLIIADNGLLHGDNLEDDEIVTLVTLPHPAPSTIACNTIMLTLDRPTPVSIEVRTLDGQRRLREEAPANTIRDGFRIGNTIQGMIDNLANTRTSAAHVPVFCAALHHDGWHTYSRAHQSIDRLCFIRTSSEGSSDRLGDISWLRLAHAAHWAHAPVLNTHQCVVPDELMGKELEVKFTLPSDTPFWELALNVHDRLAIGRIPDMVPRFGLDFETSEYDNHLYAVHGPLGEQGYVSFMNVRPNRYWIKRKNYEKDALIRSETISSETLITGALDSYVRINLGLDATALPAFRRIRYDVMCESVATGNHFCLSFDRSYLRDTPDKSLIQCEIEYVRSRRVLPINQELVLDEFNQLAEWVADWMTDQHVVARRGFYSKLSFLKDTEK